MITTPRKQSRKDETIIQPPHFLTFQPTTHYIFLTKNITDAFKVALVRGLGYRDMQKIDLTGKNHNDLLKSLLNNDTQRTRMAYKEPIYKPIPKITNFGTDCTFRKEKSDYVNDLFKDDVPLQKLTFNIVNKQCVTKELKGKTFSAAMTLCSPNIANMIANMAEQRIISTPLPEYMKIALKKRRNNFQIKEDEG